MIILLFILMIAITVFFVWQLCEASKDEPLTPPIEDYEAFYIDGHFDYHIIDWRKEKTAQ